MASWNLISFSLPSVFADCYIFIVFEVIKVFSDLPCYVIRRGDLRNIGVFPYAVTPPCRNKTEVSSYVKNRPWFEKHASNHVILLARSKSNNPSISLVITTAH